VRSDAPVEGFGVGTSLTTSSDAPSLDAVYKLQEYAGKPRRKRSHSKATWPGVKQVFRHYDDAGRMQRDVVTFASDSSTGTPLLEHVMSGGRRMPGAERLTDARARVTHQLGSLPSALRSLAIAAEQFPVQTADGVRALARELDLQCSDVHTGSGA
jgi:nicotinate phosphoribosyltransferase